MHENSMEEGRHGLEEGSKSVPYGNRGEVVVVVVEGLGQFARSLLGTPFRQSGNI